MSATRTRHSVDLGEVQETLLIPLYGRAVETRKPRGLLRDPKAVEMVEAIAYDFRKFDGARSLFGTVVRTAVFDLWVRSFLDAHPAGTVVEIGCGLNTRLERVDNGLLQWIDLDLPDSIALRRRFFVETDRRRVLAASVLDDDWVDAVRACPGPYFFAIEGVLIYLDEAQVRSALGSIARHFRGARVAFDTGGQRMIDEQHKHDVLKKMDARLAWACDDPRAIERWGLGLRLLESRSYAELPAPLRPRLPFFYRYVIPLLLRKQVAHYKLNLFEVG
jgi:O-methyltransferase involved in polyketide biosynthesis